MSNDNWTQRNAITRATSAGITAYIAGANPVDNPHDITIDGEKHLAWRAGWLQEQSAEHAQLMAASEFSGPWEVRVNGGAWHRGNDEAKAREAFARMQIVKPSQSKSKYRNATIELCRGRKVVESAEARMKA